MQIVNLTPHTITLIGPDGQQTSIAPTSPPARVTMDPPALEASVDVDGISVPIMRTSTAGTITGLPDPRDGILYLVSLQVAMAAPDRSDLVVSNDAVRDANNQIIGCRSLARPTTDAPASVTIDHLRDPDALVRLLDSQVRRYGTAGWHGNWIILRRLAEALLDEFRVFGQIRNSCIGSDIDVSLPGWAGDEPRPGTVIAHNGTSALVEVTERVQWSGVAFTRRTPDPSGPSIR